MKNDFCEFVAVELHKSLPAAWQIIPDKNLKGTALYKISRPLMAIKDGKASSVYIFVLPHSLQLNEKLKKELLSLRDDIIANKALLIIINEEIGESYLSDKGVFISESLLIHCPYFLWITSCRDKDYQITFDGIYFEDLHTGFSEVWNAKVKYEGPETGFKLVNLEIMSDACRKCKRRIKTVTGIVFPNQYLKSWNNANWQYYLSLVSLIHIKGNTADVIAAFVTVLRQHDPDVTPVGFKIGSPRKGRFAASCPHCGTLRGNFHVMDDRMDYLHSLQSRMDGALTYHTISLNIDRYLIQSLFESSEACEHTTEAGWGRHQSFSVPE